MKNKIFICSALLLLLPLTTQCMEVNHTQAIISQKITISTLKTKRDEFKKTLDENHFFWWMGMTYCPNEFFLSCTYRQNFHKTTYGQRSLEKGSFPDAIRDKKFFGQFNIDELKNINNIDSKWLVTLQKTRIDDYSALGSATMAEEVTFEEKQKFIQKLLNLGFEPTVGDRELALVERWERIESIRSIYIQKICLLISASNNSQVPRDLVQYILSLKFDTELLF
jgi:hypothetical protein